MDSYQGRCSLPACMHATCSPALHSRERPSMDMKSYELYEARYQKRQDWNVYAWIGETLCYYKGY